jgi:hypothetical protein
MGNIEVILLDTHAVVWLVLDPDKLSKKPLSQSGRRAKRTMELPFHSGCRVRFYSDTTEFGDRRSRRANYPFHIRAIRWIASSALLQ